MRKLVYYIAVTMDGFIAAPDNSYDYLAVGKHFDRYIELFPEAFPTPARPHFNITAENQYFDTVVMGRGTYDPGLKVGLTSPYAHLRQIVFSRSVPKDIDPAVEIVEGDPVPFVQALKQQEGKHIWLCGGGKLASQLANEIDELILKVNPVIIGSGIPLFAGDFQPRSFVLESSERLANSVLLNRYSKA